jgi:hypothetical protein
MHRWWSAAGAAPFPDAAEEAGELLAAMAAPDNTEAQAWLACCLGARVLVARIWLAAGLLVVASLLTPEQLAELWVPFRAMLRGLGAGVLRAAAAPARTGLGPLPGRGCRRTRATWGNKIHNRNPTTSLLPRPDTSRAGHASRTCLSGLNPCTPAGQRGDWPEA